MRGRGHSIERGGGLQVHLAMLGIEWALWVRIVESNWMPPTENLVGHYKGQRTIARILGVSDASVIKWLKIYDNEIGRTRTYERQKQK